MTTGASEFEPSTTDRIERRPRRGALEHWVWLILASLVIVASFALEVRGTEQVGSSFGPDFVLPPLCAFRGLLGINCPGCGLTRSFIYLAHGNWRASWEMHHMGWLFALAVAWQIPYRIFRLYRPGKIRFHGVIISWLSYGLLGLFLVNWLLNVLFSQRP